jgi:hypothetical protein
VTSQRRDPRIDQFSDQLLAQLRDSPAPLTTREVAADVGVRRIELWPVRGGLTARVGDTVRGRCIISCEGTDQLGNVMYLVAKPGTDPHHLPRSVSVGRAGKDQAAQRYSRQPQRPVDLPSQRGHRRAVRRRRS